MEVMDLTSTNSVGPVELRQRTRSSSGEAFSVTKSSAKYGQLSSDSKSVVDTTLSSQTFLHRHAVKLASLIFIGLTVLLCSYIVWPSYYCIEDVLPFAEYKAYPDPTYANAKKFIYMIVDSVPSIEGTERIIPAIEANEGIRVQKMIQDRSETDQFSTELQPMMATGTFIGPRSDTKGFFTDFPGKTLLVTQIQELNLPTSCFQWWGEFDFVRRYSMWRWDSNAAENPVLASGVDYAFEQLDEGKVSGALVYSIRIDALGHMLLGRGNAGYDNAMDEVVTAAKKMAEYVSNHPDTIAIIASDHGVSDVSVGGSTGMHGLADGGNSAWSTIFASKDTKLPWLEGVSNNREDWMKVLYDKQGEYTPKELRNFEPSPPWDLIMRHIDLPATISLFLKDMPFPPNSIGMPYGPNVAMKNVADLSATELCRMLQERGKELIKTGNEGPIADFLQNKLKKTKSSDLCDTPANSRTYGTQLSTLFAEHWCTRSIYTEYYITISAVTLLMMVTFFLILRPRVDWGNLGSSDSILYSQQTILGCGVFVTFTCLEGFGILLLGGGEPEGAFTAWRPIALIPFIVVAIASDFCEELSSFYDYLRGQTNQRILAYRGTDKEKKTVFMNKVKSSLWTVGTVTWMVVLRRGGRVMDKLFKYPYEDTGYSVLGFFVLLICTFYICFDCMQCTHVNLESPSWWQTGETWTLPVELGSRVWKKRQVAIATVVSLWVSSTTLCFLLYYQEGPSKSLPEGTMFALYNFSWASVLLAFIISAILRRPEMPTGITPALGIQFGIVVACSYSFAQYMATVGAVTICMIRMWQKHCDERRKSSAPAPPEVMMPPFFVYFFLITFSSGQIMNVSRIEYPAGVQTWTATWGVSEIAGYTMLSYILSTVVGLGALIAESEGRCKSPGSHKSEQGIVPSSLSGLCLFFGTSCTVVMCCYLFSLFYNPWNSRVGPLHAKHNVQLGLSMDLIRYVVFGFFIWVVCFFQKEHDECSCCFTCCAKDADDVSSRVDKGDPNFNSRDNLMSYYEVDTTDEIELTDINGYGEYSEKDGSSPGLQLSPVNKPSAPTELDIEA